MRKHLATTTGVQRLLYGGVAGITVGLLPLPLGGTARALLGWCFGVAVYLTLAWWLTASFTAQQTRDRAVSLDQPNLLILVSMLVVVAVSVAAIGVLLQQVRQLSGIERIAHIALAMVALAGSWLMIHTIYAFHYAHRYYQQQAMQRAEDDHGLDFPGTAPPHYFDFLYYSLVVGMTSQVSDVQIVSPVMRRITLVHSVLSFGFNMLVLALSINVVAGSMQ
ncbi:MAG: DUF1345 domain-containing protein [Comamonadaceae bacterium]|nr:MAG: DUF1345 domain-containing protein [Comamonadaceae bacterium]